MLTSMLLTEPRLERDEHGIRPCTQARHDGVYHAFGVVVVINDT